MSMVAAAGAVRGERPNRILNAYVSDYLKVEIAAEAVVPLRPSWAREPTIRAVRQGLRNWFHHELSAANAYSEAYASLRYWRLSTGTEVDFIVNDMEVAIEAKATARVTDHHLKGLRELAADHPEVGQRVVVCLESRLRRTSDGVLILSASEFVQRLGEGELIATRSPDR